MARKKTASAAPGRSMDWNIFFRLMRYVFVSYKWHLLAVVIGIFVGVLASVQGTLFMQTLIDVYILPMIGSESPDFAPLAEAILKVAIFYGIGVCSTWIYNRIPDRCKNLETICSSIWRVFPFNILTPMHTGILCPYTQTILIHFAR